MTKITLFSQIIKRLDRHIFRTIVKEKGTDKHSKGINSWTHLIAMLFLQFSASNSLREICNGLRSATGNLVHLGVMRSPSKSSLSYINEKRDWTLFRDYYFKLLSHFSNLAGFKQKKFKIKSKIYLLDSTVIFMLIIANATAYSEDSKLIIGRVINAETGEPVPGATVRLVETNRGTYANRHGHFRLSVPTGKQILRISSLGYVSQKIDLRNRTDSVAIKLKPSSVMMGSVEVTGDISANQVVTRAIARKRDNLSKIKTFTGLLYSKLTIELGGSILGKSDGSAGLNLSLPFSSSDESEKVDPDSYKYYVMETFSNTYIDYPGKINHSGIIQRRQTANITPQANLLALGNYQSFYEERISIGNAQFVTPLATDAFSFYDFEIIDKTMIDERFVYIVSVIPTTKTYPAFQGTIKIIEGTYNLIEADLKISEYSAIAFVNNLSFLQKFEEIKNDIWYPTFLEVSAVANIEIVKSIIDIEADFKTVSIYSEMSVNEPLPDSLYQKNTPRISVAQKADTIDNSFWEQNSLRDISQRELEMYTKVEAAAVKMDSTKIRSTSKLFDYSIYWDFNRVGSISLGAIPELNYKNLNLSTKYSYSIGQKRSFGDVSLAYTMYNKLKSNITLRGSIFSALTEMGNNQSYSRKFNTVLSLLEHDDYYNYLRKDGYNIGADLSHKYMNLWLDFESAKHYSLDKSTNRTLFSKESLRRNPECLSGKFDILSGGINISNSNVFNFGDAFTYSFDVTSLVGNRQSDEQIFHANEASASLSIPTFKTGYLKMMLHIAVQAGFANKDLPVQNQFVLNSNMLFIPADYTFATAPTAEFGGTEYAAFHLNFNTRDLFWRMLRLPRYQGRGLELLFGGSSARFNNLSDSFLAPADWYSEIGFGIGKIPTFFNNILFLETNFRWGIGNIAKNRFGFNINLSSPL
jgi:hypothetical protein